MSPHKNSNNKSSVNTGLAAVPEMGITSVYWHCTSLCNEGLSLCPSLWHFACLSFHWQNVLCPQPALGCTVSIGYLFTSQTTLRVKNFSLYPNWTSFIPTWLSSFCCALLWGTCFHPLWRMPSLCLPEAAVRSHWNHVFSKLRRSISLSLSLQGKCFSPNHTCGLLLKLLQVIDVFLILGHLKMDTVFWMWFIKCWAEGAVTFLYLLLMQPRELLAFSAAFGQKGQREQSRPCSHLN